MSSVRCREERPCLPTADPLTILTAFALCCPPTLPCFPHREGGSSAVLCALKLRPKRRPEILREFPDSPRGTAKDRDILRIRISRASWNRGRTDQSPLPPRREPHCGRKINRGAQGSRVQALRGALTGEAAGEWERQHTSSRPLAHLSH